MTERILDAAYADPDCGCPVEEWIVNGICLVLHFEEDGSMEAFADTGDWDCNVPLKATSMAEARQEAFAWADAIPLDPNS